jgi:hypothetical protein
MDEVLTLCRDTTDKANLSAARTAAPKQSQLLL